MPGVMTPQRAHRGGITDPVAVPPLGSRKPGVKCQGHPPDAPDANLWAADRVERRAGAVEVAEQARISRDVTVDGLRKRVDTAVGTASGRDVDWRAHQLRERVLQDALYGPLARLPGEASEPRPVVREVNPDPDRRYVALPRDRSRKTRRLCQRS